jgi:hypothetical protein
MQPFAKAAQAMEEINAINREAETQILSARGSGKAADVSSTELQLALLRSASDPGLREARFVHERAKRHRGTVDAIAVERDGRRRTGARGFIV